MVTLESQKIGGQRTAKILRQKAEDNYYLNPVICKNCTQVVHPKEKEKIRQVKQKKFCNASCSAIYNNKRRTKKVKLPKIKKVRIEIKKHENFSKRTKKDLFEKCIWQSARTLIRRHAKYVYDQNNKMKCCYNCLYNKHYEICHIKPVSKFSREATMAEINAPDNLIGLCPNCHWEFDNELLELKNIAGWTGVVPAQAHILNDEGANPSPATT